MASLMTQIILDILFGFAVMTFIVHNSDICLQKVHSYIPVLHIDFLEEQVKWLVIDNQSTNTNKAAWQSY